MHALRPDHDSIAFGTERLSVLRKEEAIGKPVAAFLPLALGHAKYSPRIQSIPDAISRSLRPLPGPVSVSCTLCILACVISGGIARNRDVPFV